MSNDKAPLHMVDVLGQYARIQDDIDKAVLDVVKSGQYINDAFAAHLRQPVMQKPCCVNCENFLSILTS